MAEAVDGTEIKLRNFELPDAAGRLQPDSKVALDGNSTGPLSGTPKVITEYGIAKLSFGSDTDLILPPGSIDVPRIPVAVGNRVKIHTLDDIVSGGTFYLGPKQFPPTVDNNGLPLVTGHLYYNTIELAFFVFSPAGTWVLASAAFPGALKAYYYLPAIDTTIIPLGGPLMPDSRGNVLTFALTGAPTDRDPINLYLNGALLCNNVDYIITEGGAAGDYITLVHAAQGGSVIVVQVLGKPTIDYASNAVSVNTAVWLLNGSTKTFPLRNIAGDDVIPTSTINCIVGINGRVIDPTRDYTVSGPSITFVDAPLAGDEVFVTVGLPIGDAVGLNVPSQISPFSYGAVGNGVADDTAALAAAINEVNSRKAMLDLSRGNFRITAPLPVITNPMIDGHGSGSLYIDFNLNDAALLECYIDAVATFDVTALAVTTFDFAGAFSGDTEVTAVTLTVPAGSIPPVVGDIVKLTGPVQIVGAEPGDHAGQHLYVAAAVNTSGTTWVIYAPTLLTDTYGTTGRQVQILNRNQHCTIKDLTVRSNYTRLVAEDWRGICIRVVGAVSPYTTGLTFEDTNQGLFLVGTWRASTNSTFCRRLRNATASETPAIVGYGVVDAGSYMSVHSDLSGDDCRHVYTTLALNNANPRLMWGRAHRPTINGGAAGNCSASAYDTHSDAHEAHFHNLEIDGGYFGENSPGGGIQFRGNRCRASNCHVRNGPLGFQMYKQNAGEIGVHRLDNCSYIGTGTALRVDRNPALTGADKTQTVRIRNFFCITSFREAIRILDTYLEIEGFVRVNMNGSTQGVRAIYIEDAGVVNSIGAGRLVFDVHSMTGTPTPRMISYEGTGCGSNLSAEVIAGTVVWQAWVSDNDTPSGAPAGSWYVDGDCDKAPLTASGGYSQFGPNSRLAPGSLRLRATLNRSRQTATDVKATAFNLVNSDYGKIFTCTAALTITIPIVEILGYDFQCTVISTSGSVTLDGPGGTNATVAAGSRAEIKVANGRVYTTVTTQTDMS